VSGHGAQGAGQLPGFVLALRSADGREVTLGRRLRHGGRRPERRRHRPDGDPAARAGDGERQRPGREDRPRGARTAGAGHAGERESRADGRDGRDAQEGDAKPEGHAPRESRPHPIRHSGGSFPVTDHAPGKGRRG
jgi:hypothetical protein